LTTTYGEAHKLLDQPNSRALAERAFQRLLDDAAAPARRRAA
jgi:hypothetical protein